MSEPLVYMNGAYMPKSSASVSLDDRGFLFADGIYDVIRAVDGRLFESDAHVARLTRNAEDLGLRIPPDLDVLEISRRLLKDNRLLGGDAAVYVQVTRGVAPRTHAFPGPSVAPTVYLTAFPFTRRLRWHTEGVSVKTVADTRWTRCDIKSVSLLPNVLAAEEAHQAGADEAVFVRDGVVLEGAHSSLFGVLDGVVTTAPLSNVILPGITRRVILELARGLEIPVEERGIQSAELPRVEELFLTGTTTDVAPIVSVDGSTVGSGSPGPVTQRLQKALFALLDAGSPSDS